MSEELLEAPVLRRQRFGQEAVQFSKESQSIQAVEGEAAGKRQQPVGRVDGSRGRVGHNVSIHRTAESRWQDGEEK